MPFFCDMRTAIFIFFCFLTGYATGQNAVSGSVPNAVPNAQFEEYVYCPAGINQSEMEILVDWKQMGSGTPDYYNTCGKDMGVPANIFGVRSAAAGSGYAGLVAYSPSKRDYREYLQARINFPLRAGEWYCLEMKVALADNAQYVCDGMGAVVSELPYRQRGHTNLSLKPQLSNPDGHLLYFQPDWVHLSTSFMAGGGEEYIIIGNFKPDKELDVKARNVEVVRGKPVHHAYYYLDDVILRPATGPDDCSNTVIELAKIAAEDDFSDRDYRTVRLQSVLFDFDRDVINPEAEDILGEVLLVLKRNPYYEIEVAGHSDIIGTENYNVDLSKRRSERVIDFLSSRGIASDRLRINYHGSAQPVTTNETEEGRQQNRRVEFLIVEKQYEEMGK